MLLTRPAHRAAAAQGLTRQHQAAHQPAGAARGEQVRQDLQVGRGTEVLGEGGGPECGRPGYYYYWLGFRKEVLGEGRSLDISITC